MSPLDLLEEGIKNRNWFQAVDGFNQLTGKRLVRPITEEELKEVKDWMPSEEVAKEVMTDMPPFVPTHLSVHDTLEIIADEKTEKVVKKRGRPKKVKVVEATVEPQPDNFDKFRIKLNPTPPVELDEDGRKKSRALPFDFIAAKKNSWVDDKNIAADEIPTGEYDKKMKERAATKERRPPPRMTKIECTTCHDKVEIELVLAAKYADPTVSDSPKPSFVCEKCLKRK